MSDIYLFHNWSIFLERIKQLSYNHLTIISWRPSFHHQWLNLEWKKTYDYQVEMETWVTSRPSYNDWWDLICILSLSFSKWWERSCKSPKSILQLSTPMNLADIFTLSYCHYIIILQIWYICPLYVLLDLEILGANEGKCNA